MSRTGADVLLQHLQYLAVDQVTAQAADSDLLRRFTQRHDEAAFTALVRRHGAMVYHVCRRTLGNTQDAEDACQATFLALAARAGSGRWRGSLAGWLHEAARRIALKARTATARRQKREGWAEARTAGTPLDEITARELQEALDEELARLPEKYRSPLVLCYFEGATRDEAARQLGWPASTLKLRIERGRELLRQRFAKRGVSLSAALGAVALTDAPASAALLQATARAALPVGISSPHVLALAHGGLRAWPLLRLKIAAVVLLAAGLLAGFGLAVGSRSETTPRAAESQPEADEREAKADLHGDPLPQGAVMRLGTLERRAVGAELALTRDGKSIIGVRVGRYISVWDADTGKLRQTRKLPVAAADGSWLSPDGRWLAQETIPPPTGFTVWDVQAGKQVQAFTIKAALRVRAVAFAPDGTQVAAAAEGNQKAFFCAWDLAAGTQTLAQEVVKGGNAIQALTFTPDGKRLLGSVSEHGTCCWDLASGERVWHNKEFVPNAMVFTPDGKVLAPGHAVLDLATGKPANLGKNPLAWNTRPTLTPDGRTLLIWRPDVLTVWDMVNRKEVLRLVGAGEQVLVAPDSKTVITSNGALQRWELATGKPLWAETFEQGHVGEVVAVKFSADSKRLASASEDGSVRLWDVTTGKPLRVWRAHDTCRPVGFLQAGVTALDLSPDGRWVLSAGPGERFLLHDAVSGKQVISLALPERQKGEGERVFYRVWISPDGAKAQGLFTATNFLIAKPMPRLATWDLRTGKLLHCHPIEDLHWNSCAIAPDGRTLLSRGTLIDMDTGNQIARMEGLTPRGYGEPFALSADGALAVGVFIEETKRREGVRVWEAATGKTVAHLKTESRVERMAFHPNNRFLVTNDSARVQLWDTLTGKVAGTRTVHEQVPYTTTGGSYVSCLAFAPDGHLAAGHPDGTILLWDLPPPPHPPEPLAAKALDSLWNDLAGADAAKAWQAVWRLADAPADTLAWLRDKLRPIEPAPAELTRRLLADLDADSFEKRREAARRLKELGPLAGPALRQALVARPSAEQKRRIEEVLQELEAPAPPMAEALRALRAVSVLERVGAPEARRVLAELAKGVPEARLTQEAKAALERLARR
jgi:RNA polymerase sigma factor (sigma-70 family)